MALLQDAMETRDAVALAHAWACAAPGDDAERLGDALSSRCSAASTARPRATSALARRSGCARSTRRRTTTAATAAARRSSTTARARGFARARAAARAPGARRARRGARRGARAAAAGRARGRGGRGAALRGAARAAPARGAVEAAAALGRARAGRLLASPREPARRLAALFATVDGLERDAAATEAYVAARADAHYGDHCVFVVQLRGRKRWRLYGPALECPTLHEATLPPPPELLRRGR
ncbi:H3-K4 specific histone demethylase [Aureococcus anophagefferens]|uniref:H3-K4 specific histone demethylase n=1 Tax=Aureococcus anophagefferens TaxID=44056 RepID=A0ABR1GFJ3_AURAN